MRIKKHHSHNEYIRAGDLWIRNFTKKTVQPLNINKMLGRDDYHQILENESAIESLGHGNVADDVFFFPKIVIVSDGYAFEQRQKLLAKLPSDVVIIGLNKVLAKWKLMLPTVPVNERRPMNLFLANNPYKECMSYLPPKHAKYYPACVISTRTYGEFAKRYLGNMYTYDPTPEDYFGFERSQKYFIDDYRNPVCAAISLSYHFGVRKLMLLTCDDSFEEQREFAVKLPNGLWAYPQQLRSQEIIDANLYWLTHQEEYEVKVADYSNGSEYKNAAYIQTDEEALDFFNEDGTKDE